jgi:hypothetical protein
MEQPNSRKSEPGKRDQRESARARTTGNFILLGLFAAVIGIAVWLVNTMIDQRAVDDCAAQGRRNCAPVGSAGDQR